MKKKFATLVVGALLCLNFSSYGQSPAALHVGDKLPQAFWDAKHMVTENSKIVRQDLSAYKDKLLIIDFWATWCGSCTSKFPALEKLQADFSADLKAMLVNSKVVTGDSAGRAIQKLGGKLPPYKSYTLPSIVDDSLLVKYFGLRMVPTYIWIFNGRISAITGAEFVTEQNVMMMIKVRNDETLAENKRLQRITKKGS